jgi:helix-turn-helix protein
MKQLKHFNQFISEELGKDEENELKSMGFSDYSAPFEERYKTLVDEWSYDPEVNAAIDTLKSKFQELFEKHIDSESDDDAQELEQVKTWMYDSSGIDDIGWFEYILLNDLLY